MKTMNTQLLTTYALLGLISATLAAEPRAASTPVDPATIKHIKAYYLDFNWAATRRKCKPLASPGKWVGADPAQHVACYRAIVADLVLLPQDVVLPGEVVAEKLLDLGNERRGGA